MSNPFFLMHSGLDREGPGSREDIQWVAEKTALARDARICDAGCGPGGDISGLLAVAPEGKITAVDSHRPFIDELNMRVGADSRVMAYVGNMAKLKGPFDLIWCAGAVYFLGINAALNAWRYALAKGGFVAFSEPCLFRPPASQDVRDYWDGYAVKTAEEIDEQVVSAGYETVDSRRIGHAAWAAYYDPLQQRITQLRTDADEELNAVLDEGQREIDLWDKVRDDTGYLLSIVRPV